MSHYLTQARKATQRIQKGALDGVELSEASDYVLKMIDNELQLIDGEPDVSIAHALMQSWKKLEVRADGLMEWFAQERRVLGQKHDESKQWPVLYLRQKKIYKYGTIYCSWAIYKFAPKVGGRDAGHLMFDSKTLRANKTGEPYPSKKLLKHTHEWDADFVLQAESEANIIRCYTQVIAKTIKQIKKIEKGFATHRAKTN